MNGLLNPHFRKNDNSSRDHIAAKTLNRFLIQSMGH